PRHKHASDARHVVACVESVPGAAEVDFEPRGKIHNAVGRRGSHVAQVTGTTAGWNIHAAAEGDGQMRVVAADAAALLEGLPCGSGGAGVFIAKDNVVVDKIANRLHALPSRDGLAE